MQGTGHLWLCLGICNVLHSIDCGMYCDVWTFRCDSLKYRIWGRRFVDQVAEVSGRLAEVLALS